MSRVGYTFHRQGIFRRDGWRCRYCGLEVLTGVHDGHPRLATLDHYLPRCRGGTGHVENLVTSCLRCNQEKNDMLPDVYLWFRHMRVHGYPAEALEEAIVEVMAEIDEGLFVIPKCGARDPENKKARLEVSPGRA